MLRVFAASWSENCPIDLEVHRIDAPDTRRYESEGADGWVYDSNTAKLEYYAHNFTTDTIFTDCDMLCRGDITCAFDRIEHIGYTTRVHNRLKFNLGVVFFKHTDYARRFMDKWVRINRVFYNNPALHHYWRLKKGYGGINQAAFGWMLENGWVATELPQTYNLVTRWDDWERAKMIHVFKNLRNGCLRNSGAMACHPIGKLYRKYELELTAHER